ncbi:F0F1 ATP synthase subunit gamma [Candidatus Gottesmanbacteria bacterium]|nr:F0F1 ATP synthase subunit gamma [Candidatus Gottesmanbacteria bacterium]
MKNATDAALDFMQGLTLELNKARQEKITYEIADMVTARMAVSD